MSHLREYDSAGQFKQEILRVYNAVNQQVSGVGARQLHVDLLGDRILIMALHQRVPALSTLDKDRRDLTRQLDVALIDRFKELLSAELKNVLGNKVLAILKDYDHTTELACTLIVTDGDIAGAYKN